MKKSIKFEKIFKSFISYKWYISFNSGKMKKQIAFLVLILFSLLLIQEVSAIKAYLRPPKMIIYTNVSLTKPGITQNSLVIKNLNDVNMNVSLKPDENMTDIITLDKSFIMLQPNETAVVNFTTKVTKVGRYDGKILATYTIEEFIPITLEAQVTILASGRDYIASNFYTIVALIGIVVIILGIGVYWFRFKK